MKRELEYFANDPVSVAMDNLHKAAFRRGLGNSICASPHMIGAFEDEHLHAFVNSTFTGDRIAIAGSGVDADQLVSFAESLDVPKSGASATTSVSSFTHGDSRTSMGSPLTYVALAGAAPAIGDAKGVAAAQVLKHALGTGATIPWVVPTVSLIGRKLPPSPQIGEDPPICGRAFSAHYSDAGLLGLVVAAGARDIGGAASSAIKLLKAGSIAEEDVKRGKQAAARALIQGLEDSISRTDALVERGILGGDLAATLAAVESVSAADVNAVAKSVAKSIAIGVAGNTIAVPYTDEVK